MFSESSFPQPGISKQKIKYKSIVLIGISKAKSSDEKRYHPCENSASLALNLAMLAIHGHVDVFGYIQSIEPI